ncbi:MAG: DsbC family protein [Stagnimonas sp.]|nr:DsbC family protein [Stagnimonas sp.]
MSLSHPGRLALICASLSLAASTASCAPPMPAEGGKAKTESKPAAAAPVAREETPDAAQLRAKLAERLPDVALDSVHPAAVPGLFEIRRGSLFGYVTADGKYLISGDLVNLETGEELTENSRKASRIELLAQLDGQTIDFFPQDQPPQFVVTAFTDTDCGYCRKLHSEIADYNALGIGIRYAFFPRQGPGSESFKQAESVWCAMDRKTALTQAKLGAHLAEAPKGCKNPVLAQYQLGSELGLRGTPMLILPDGEVVNGYVPAERLAQRLVEASLPPAAKGAP